MPDCNEREASACRRCGRSSDCLCFARAGGGAAVAEYEDPVAAAFDDQLDRLFNMRWEDGETPES